MLGMTLHQLRCLDAVVSSGSFQSAADKLNRTHPSVFTAIKALEQQTGLQLFDRSGYRVTLTSAGESFHRRAKAVLSESSALSAYAAQLASGEEASLAVVIGDVCPLPPTLSMLRSFFRDCPDTRLDLHVETLQGPVERLLDGDVNLIVHHIDKSDTRLEFIDVLSVRFIPVAAPGFLGFELTDELTPEQLRHHAQCVIRDSARHLPALDLHIIEGARQWTVSDQYMKKEILIQGMGWGHVPSFMIDQEIASGKLVCLEGKHLRGNTVDLVAARLRARPAGPVATKLWAHILASSQALHQAVDLRA
jgi:DNA-binding transcriptional LysR family regulator